MLTGAAEEVGGYLRFLYRVHATRTGGYVPHSSLDAKKKTFFLSPGYERGAMTVHVAKTSAQNYPDIG